MKEEKDWGWYEVLYEEENLFLIKKLVIHPKQSISYQQHFGRSEMWYLMCRRTIVIRSSISITIKT
jgi:mannose-6-phosphate isomerase-like protein (cupin superfamily)